MAAQWDWEAWISHRPPAGPTLFVRGVCRDPGGPGLVLRPSLILAGGRPPALSGPAAVRRGGPPPTFSVDAGAGRLYVVELAAAVEQFVLRDGGKFYGSWQDGAALTAPTYTPPAAVWGQLATHDQVFVRLVTTSDPQTWADVAASTDASAADGAPFVTVLDRALPALAEPQTCVLDCLPDAARRQRAGGERPAAVSYRGPAPVSYERVVLLPGATVVPVEQVY